MKDMHVIKPATGVKIGVVAVASRSTLTRRTAQIRMLEAMTCLLETGSRASCLVFYGQKMTSPLPSAKDCLASL